jgi:Domain of unknown function (DUF222)/HNH endonuclease
MTMLTDLVNNTSDSADPRDPADLPLERVEAEICTLAGQIAAATCRFLRLLADFDAREGWAGWQVRSCAHWLSWRCGMDLRTAREHVRVARAMADLPRVTSSFAAGRLSYSKVRALTRVATPRTEDDLVEAALHAPAAQVERLVRGLHTAQDSEAALDAGPGRRATRPGVQWRWADDGSLVVWGRLAPADGARLLAGLTRLEHQRTRTTDSVGVATERADAADGSAEHPDSEPSTHEPTVVAGALSDLGPALIAAAELACTTYDAPIHAPGAEVVVHVDADAFVESARRALSATGDPAESPAAAESAAAREPAETAPSSRPEAPKLPAGRLDDGPALTAATIQMLACDGRIRLSVDGPDGRTLDLGRRRRRPTNRQLVALWRRDRGCAVPGCGRARFLHAHHVRPWASGGKTNLDNLLLLCGEHHRLLHDRRFAIDARGRQRFRFSALDGRPVPPAPDTVGTAAALAATHHGVGPSAIEPDWDGSSLHLHEAVASYLAAWAAGEGGSAGPQTQGRGTADGGPGQ